MKMNEHILAALGEQIDRWEDLLGSLGSNQITTPLSPSQWSIKDNLAHLWAWQQRSIARFEAALSNREPEFPEWLPGLDPDSEDDPDQTNNWIYEAYRALPWADVYRNWREGFRRFLNLGAKISERELLDTGKYPWLKGYSLALILLASYDHHQEHFEELSAWLEEHRNNH